MRKENFTHLECSLARSLDVIGEWWTLLIVRDLFYGINTFDELCRDLGIARNMLTDRLKKLTGRGVLEKYRPDDSSPRSRYRLTPKGKGLFPVVMALAAWGDTWEAPEGPPINFRHGHDLHNAEPVMTCGKCGERITPGNIRPEAAVGAARRDALPLPLRKNSGSGLAGKS